MYQFIFKERFNLVFIIALLIADIGVDQMIKGNDFAGVVIIFASAVLLFISPDTKPEYELSGEPPKVRTAEITRTGPVLYPDWEEAMQDVIPDAPATFLDKTKPGSHPR
jgi:hypothetical protein